MAEMKLGFLPLYLAFYKEAVPSCLAAAETFAGRIAGLLRSVGAETVERGVCCTREEISAAVCTSRRETAEKEAARLGRQVERC